MITPEISSLTAKAVRTRQAIINAARKLIGSEGVDGVTVMAVCGEAQVGRTSFYNYFEDTPALLGMLANDVNQELQSEFETVHAGLERGLGRLECCLSMLLNKASTDPELGLLITALARNNPGFTKLLEEQIQIELEAAVVDGELELSPIELDTVLNFLTVAVLALMHEIAEKQMLPADTDGYVGCLMQAVKRLT